MKSIILISLIVVAILILTSLLSRKRGAAAPPDIIEEAPPYYARRLMSAREQQVFNALKRALPDLQIHSQVSLSAIVGIKGKRDNLVWLNKINQKRLDFVVCDQAATVLAVIELDDRSHDDPRRSKADQDKDAALSAASIRLLRWNATSIPSFDEIAAEFQGLQQRQLAIGS
jgi:hypothetical protein